MSTAENNLIAMLQSRSRSDGNGVAYRFIEDEEALAKALTYAALNRQAAQIAITLRKHCQRGDRVLMMYHSCSEFIPAFFGCLYAGVIAVPAYPPRKNHNAQRLFSIIEDAGVSVVMSTTRIHRQAGTMEGDGSILNWPVWIDTDEIKDTVADDPAFVVEMPKGDDVMFLQYTSGSTGKPKGVIVTHENIMTNLAMLYEALQVNKKSVYISWLPYFHDMGLIGVILEAMYAGVTAVMMNPAYFLQKPIRWLKAISEHGGTVSGAPNFAYDLCVDKIRDEDLEGIDLSTWKVAFNGSEPVSAKTIDRFCKRFEKYGFDRGAMLPSFGLAEATLFVSAKLNKKGPNVLPVDQSALLKGLAKKAGKNAQGVDIVSCGKTWHDHELAIVDPVSRERCAEGQVGELWFKGKSVAKGYWNKPEQSKETFEAYITDSDDGPFLRTGDLAFLARGELYITGRLKDVLIIRGGNYYPQDLELTAWESHPALSPNNTAVFSIDTETGTQLVIVQEVQRTAVRGLQANEVFEAIISAISSKYQLQVFDILLLGPGGVLKTSSGKIQRQGNKRAYLNNDFKPITRWRPLAGERKPQQREQHTGDVNEREYYALENWMRERVAELVGLPMERIPADKDFNSFGLDSVGAVQLSGALQTYLGIEVAPNLVYDYPSISQLAKHIVSKNKEVTKRVIADVTEEDRDVAIIGMSGRFPGAKDIEAFEQLLFDGLNLITTPGVDAPVDGDPRHVTYRAGYMPGADLFDAGFFEIAPKEATAVDPQQRLVLELCYTAMQDAGYAPQKLKGAAVGVFMGISNFDYAQLSLKHAQHKTAYFGTGVALSIAANRVSYFFDFKGPSLCIDTACSSSLVAMHQAIKSIRSGESAMALAGGVNLILSDTVNEYLDAGKLLAQDGHCKTFDASADGYVRGEGAGVLLLKSKKQAIADNDKILAVIKGSAVVQDGHSNGLLAPNGVSQQQVVQNALDDAGVQPGSVCYVEAHGTGTALGDPIEVSALDKVFKTGRDKNDPLIIGSVKANIGHLESAAGIAGLIKTVICLRKKQVPKQVHFKEHNPNISWDDLCVKIPTTILDINKTGQPLRAGVSSFGFGGTNAHVVLEEYIADVEEQTRTGEQLLPYSLVTLSGKTAEALNAQISSLHAFVAKATDLDLNNLSFSLANTRDHFLQRLVIKCSDVQELKNILKEIEQSKEDHLSVVRTEPGVSQGRKAFLFTGGGAQYQGMAAVLYAGQPVFKEAIDQCIEQANRWIEVDLKEILFAQPGTEEEALLNRIDYMQPALFAYEYAMSRLWMAWGIMPDVLIGHSLGEIVAACVSGIFDLEDGMKLICCRGRLMQSLPAGGVMISLQANEAEVQKAIAGDTDLLSVAVINGPDQTVISGDKNAAERVKKIFDHKGVKTKILQVSHASHSVLMDPILEQYGKVVASITFRKPRYTLISNVTGKEADTSISTPQYWIDHLRNTVRFSSGIKQLETLGVRALIEVGPHPVLLGIAKECMDADETTAWLPSARNTDQTVIYDSLARFYAGGGNVDWAAFYKNIPAQKIALPKYPFQKESYWIDTTTSVSSGHSTYSGKLLLGQLLDVAGEATVYESQLDLRNFGYLSDHSVMGKVLVPASLFCDMVQEYITTLEHAWLIEEIVFEKPLVLDARKITRVQLVIQKGTEQQSFTIHGNHTGEKEQSWVVVARGAIRLTGVAEEKHPKKLNDLKKQYAEVIPVGEFYEGFAIKGMEYGESFQSVVEIYKGRNGVLGKIVLPQAAGETEATTYEAHPVLLDGCFQLFNAAANDADHACLPFSVEGYKLNIPVNGTIWAELTTIESGLSKDIKCAAISLWNEEGSYIGGIEKLSVRKADASLFSNEARADYQYHLEWKIISAGISESQPIDEKWLLFTNDPAAENVLAVADVLTQKSVEVIQANDWNAISGVNDINKVVCFWNRTDATDIDNIAEANALAGLAQLQAFISTAAKNNFTKLDGYWWVVDGANPFAPGVGVDPSLATVWGLGRVFMREQQDVPFKLLDVAYDDDVKGTTVSIVDAICSQVGENELGLHAGQLYGLRLASGLYKKEIPATSHMRLCFSDSEGFSSLSFNPVNKKKLGDTEVEIEVRYAGLNFRDIFRVLGLIANDKGELGGECSGVIVNVGAAVTGFKIGDEVMALAEGSFANVVTTDHRLVALKPGNITLREAATIPIAFLTAWYGFKNLADVQHGESVLIHSAAGGVGMAAIQIVHYLGGKVYGTASQGKWDDVRKWDVSHVYDSRTLDFHQQILKDTNEKGVDVVLNSFIDQFVDKSLDLLSAGGRFLEIGKRDIRPVHSVQQSHPGISYAAYDLIYLMQHQRDLIREMFALLIPLFSNNTFRPLPATSFDIQHAQQAFQFMSKAKHTGKVLLIISEAKEEAEAIQLSANSTVLITGGLGGLGVEVAHYLVKKYKVGHLLLIGRKEPSAEVVHEIEKLRQSGTIVTTKCADVTDRAALTKVIAEIPVEYPLKGVMHLAGMLDDAMIEEQDDVRFTRVMAPKIKGAFNLHELTKDCELELFVMFSSAAVVLGSVGQSNYAAANAFLDSLAYYRRSSGLPGSSISWGPWEATGIVHRMGDEHKRRIRKQGIGLLSNTEGIALLDDVLEAGLTQPVLLPILKTRLSEVQSTLPFPLRALFKDLPDIKKNESTKKDTGAWAKQLASLNPKQRKQYLIETLQQEIAGILSVADVKKIHLDKSLQEFGMDSLMAVELRNKLSALVGKKLPVTLLFDYPNVLALADFLDAYMQQHDNKQVNDIVKNGTPGWREAIYHQLMLELQKSGGGDEDSRHEAIEAMLDELSLMMDKTMNGKAVDDNADELDNMSLEELEDEFEKELKDI